MNQSFNHQIEVKILMIRIPKLNRREHRLVHHNRHVLDQVSSHVRQVSRDESSMSHVTRQPWKSTLTSRDLYIIESI